MCVCVCVRVCVCVCVFVNFHQRNVSSDDCIILIDETLCNKVDVKW